VTGATYDVIGSNYADLRKPDPRIGAQIHAALGDARTVLNVGAGTGAYEPLDRKVIAVEPSLEMIRKRPPGSAEIIQASAEALPLEDRSFDATMAILTVHHWSDKPAAMRELRRVSRRRIVIVTYDPSCRPWLTSYLPELAALDERQMPKLDEYKDWLGSVTIAPLLIPHDCSDGFLYAYWRRPEAYLNARVRSGSSSFWMIGDVTDGICDLKNDLRSGEWARRHAALLGLEVYDAGYRIITAEF
jgi:SAM-dependent methyltransferase